MSTNQQHTPGPWIIDNDGFICWRRQDEYCRSEGGIAKMIGGNVEAKANARLIAAAPEMFAALTELLEDKYLADPINSDRMTKARQAIAKAVGQDKATGE